MILNIFVDYWNLLTQALFHTPVKLWTVGQYCVVLGTVIVILFVLWMILKFIWWIESLF